MEAVCSIETIRAARARGAGRLRKTPLLSSPLLDRAAGRRVFVKAECLQHTGSFKFRGAWSALTALDEAARARGVIAFSSGNHAQGVALAARLLKVPAVILMPDDAPRAKLDATRALGAEVITHDRSTGDRERIVAQLAAERGLTLIPPFDHPQVIAGQGTVGLEIAEQARKEGIAATQVLVPCGGGGLSAGIALALAAKAPAITVRPCEPAGFDDTARSLAAGRILGNRARTGSICDAILTPAPGALTFPILSARCGPGLVVDDAQVLDAMALAFRHLGIVLEPGGAVALAAALSGTRDLPEGDVIVVASGGNVDAALFCRALERAGG